MKTEILTTNANLSGTSMSGARLSVLAAVATLIFLIVLHILSPEYDPSFRMVSEYANGKYPWILVLTFECWAISTFALTYAIQSQLKTAGGKTGLIFLFIAGIGEAMGGMFDINHEVLHGVAGILGIFGLPVGAILISKNLMRTHSWEASKKLIITAANLTWISVVLLVLSFVIMLNGISRSGVTINPKAPVLPPGVIAFVGWTDRLIILTYCFWVMIVAWKEIKLKMQLNKGL